MEVFEFLDFLLPLSNILVDPIFEFITKKIKKETYKQKIKLTIMKSCSEVLLELPGRLPDNVFNQVYPVIEDSINNSTKINIDKLLPDISKETKSFLLSKIRIDLLDTIDLKDYFLEVGISIDELYQQILLIMPWLEKMQKEIHEIKNNENSDKRIRVLFLAANPDGTVRLKLDEEARSIIEMIQKSKYRDTMVFESRWAIRTQDILQAINEVNPSIIHFSGHGTDSDEIVLLNSDGKPKKVSKEAIVQTIMTASDTIRLVFLNSCYSHHQAEAIVEYVDFSIGMNTSIGDEAARIFAAQFYSAIGFGKSILTSFEQAKALLMLNSIPEENTPTLYSRSGLDPQKVVLIS